MRIPILVALLGATAMIPAAVSAQDHHGRSDRGDAHGQSNDRASQRDNDHAGPARPESNQGQRPNYTSRTAPNQAFQGRAAVSAARPDLNRALPSGRPDARFQADQRGRTAFAERRDQTYRDGQRSEAFRSGDVRDQRNEAYRGGDVRNQAYRGGNQRDEGYRGGHYDNRGSFNRDWRHDNRYDWRDYRTRNRDAYHLPRYYSPRGWNYGYRRFGIGFTLSAVLFGQNYWIDDPYDYRLPPAYGPYRWVRYYNDALLVDIRTGDVVDTVYDIFW